jgi:hypothetical protein
MVVNAASLSLYKASFVSISKFKVKAHQIWLFLDVANQELASLRTRDGGLEGEIREVRVAVHRGTFQG